MTNRSFIILIGALFLTTVSFAAQLPAADTYSLYCNGSYEGIKALIESDPAHIHNYDSKGGFPLMRICELESLAVEQSLELFRLLCVHNVDVNKQHSVTGKAALHSAAAFNKCRLITELLAADALIDIRKSDGLTPLMLACCFEGNEDAINLLIEHGANVNARSNPDPVLGSGGKCTALHFSAQEGLFHNMVILLRHGADKTIRTARGWTLQNFLRWAFESRKITRETYDRALRMAALDSVEQVIEGLGQLRLDNPLYDAIEGDNMEEIVRILSNGYIDEKHLRLAFQQAVEQDKRNVLVLFRDRTPANILREVIQSRVIRLRVIVDERNNEGADYNRRIAALSDQYENPQFDLEHGDWADRAQELGRMRDFQARKPVIQREIEQLRRTFAATQSGIENLNGQIEFLTSFMAALPDAQ